MEPIMENIVKKYGEKVNIQVVGLNSYNEKQNFQLAEKYKVRAVPTLVFLDKEGKEHLSNGSTMTEKEIVKVFKKMGIEE